MNVNFKKVIALLLALVMVFALVACGKTDAGSNTNPDTQQNTNDKTDDSVDTSEPTTRMIVDGYGREVEIPTVINTIAPLGNAPRMITYLGLADRVNCIPHCELVETDSPWGRFMPYAYVNIDTWKDLPNIGNDNSGAGEWFAEEIVAAAPDLVITTYAADVADDIQQQTGIPVLAIPSPELFSEEYNTVLRIIADACGVSDRAEELITYLQDSLADLDNRTKDIPDEDKPTVLGAGATFSGSHSIDGVYANYPVFEILHANDVAIGISDKSGGVLVDKEQILVWDPEMIFFDAKSFEDMVLPDYAENPDFYNSLQAVQNGELYQWPNSTSHSTNVEVPLASAYYVGAMLYPEAFADLDIDAKISEIFDMFIGAPDYIEVYEAGGYSYSKVTLE